MIRQIINDHIMEKLVLNEMTCSAHGSRKHLKVFPSDLLSFSPEVTGADGCIGHIERVQFSLHGTKKSYIV